MQGTCLDKAVETFRFASDLKDTWEPGCSGWWLNPSSQRLMQEVIKIIKASLS